MVAIGYKPGLVMDLLGISREQLRYWRRELDPRPTRALFSYQVLLGYAVFRELIVERWLAPQRLKGLDLRAFFAWFEQPRSEAELRDTVISIDKRTGVLRFQGVAAFARSGQSGASGVEAVSLAAVEARLLSRFKAPGQRTGAAASR